MPPGMDTPALLFAVRSRPSFTEWSRPLGEAHDLSRRLTVYCRASRREGLKSIRGCVGRHGMDLPTMLWTHGRDYPITRLDGRLKVPALRKPTGAGGVRASERACIGAKRA